MIDTVIIILMLLSLFFSITGVIGLFRFPDFYTRIHAAGLVGSLGLLLAGFAVMFHAYELWIAGSDAWINYSAHVLLALVISVVTTTTSTYAIASSAYHSGNTPKVLVIDALEEDKLKNYRGCTQND